MNKGLKVALNLTIFFLIVGFVWHVSSSVFNNNSQSGGNLREPDFSFESPYALVGAFDFPEDVNRFDLHDDKLFVSAAQSVFILDMEGNSLGEFQVEPEVRDVAVNGEEIYLLYPTYVTVYNANGNIARQWEAFSNLSDYCSFTLAGNSVFITDAGNRNIVKFTADGYFDKFIQSPAGFIIPSYSFDIDSWNDTIYCNNSGRHLIEKYTLDGDFIGSFGEPGGNAGYFAGCCNPVYIAFTPEGELLTSEKGNPRVSSFGRNGTFNSVWLNSTMLGSFSNACEVRALDDKLIVAARNKILIFQKTIAFAER